MTIGSLAVNITATTDKFQKGMEKARGMLGKFTSGITAAQGIVAGFAAYGLASIVSAAVEAGSALFEMTQKLQVSAESLSALHFAADQLESSAGAVDAAIAFMSKTLGKAIQGTDAAIEAFNRLNLDFEKLKSLEVDKQFLSIVDALHKIPDPAERAAAAQGVFGRGAKDLAALLAAGTDEIIRQGEEAARTGNILTSDTVAALDETADAVASLSKSWESLKVQLVGVFAPALTATANLLSGTLKALKVAWYALEDVVIAAEMAIVKAFDGILAAWNSVAPAFAQIDRSTTQGLIDSYVNQQAENIQKLRGVGSVADNPLARSAANLSGHVQTQAEEKAQAKVEQDAAKKVARDKKEEEKQIAAAAKKQNSQLQELINQGNKRGPVIQVVGVR